MSPPPLDPEAEGLGPEGTTALQWLYRLLDLSSSGEPLAETERFVIELQRSAAVGALLSGVAHDLSNMLGPISGFAELVEDAPELSDQTRRWAQILHENSGRSAQFVHTLLSFGRQGRGPREVLNGWSILENVLALARYDLERAHVELDAMVNPDHAFVDAQPGELQQIFLTVVRRAVALLAAAGGGTLKVRLETAPDSVTFNVSGRATAAPADQGGQARERTADPERGDPESQRLIDAFSLATAHWLADRQGATLVRAEEPDSGFSFRLRFPPWKRGG